MAELPKLFRKRETLSKKAQALLLLAFFLSFFVVLFASQSFFHWLSFEELNRDQVFERVRSGRPEEKTAALTQWLSFLRSETSAEEKLGSSEVAYLRSLLDVYSERGRRDPYALSLVVALLGYSEDGLGSEDFSKLESILLDAKARASEDSWQRLYAETMSTLAMNPKLWDDRILDLLGAELASLDDFQASSAAFSLGLALLRLEKGDPLRGRVVELLVERLGDSKDVVSANIAFALARIGDKRAVGTLEKLLREASKVGSSDPSFGTHRFRLYTQAMASAVNYEDETLRSMVREISMNSPHLKLRQAAKIFVEK
ncbi:hypothetical protein GW915_05190 [bacterium]|nr:hypothetical protein [bacterium]